MQSVYYGSPRYRFKKKRFYIARFWKVRCREGSIRTKTHAIILGKPLCGVQIKDQDGYHDQWRTRDRYDVECKRCWAIVNGGRPKLVPDQEGKISNDF